jgi:hypothetical protein
VQLHIKIDASRLITVDVFIPYLNEHFTDRVFIPKDEEPDYVELLKGAHLEIENCLARLARVEEKLILSGASGEDFDFPEVVYDDGFATEIRDDADRDAPAADPRRAEVERLRRELEDFDIEIGAQQAAGDAEDHDRAARIVARLREARASIAELERRAGVTLVGSGVIDANALAESAAETVNAHGTDAQRERLAALRRELSDATARGDVRGVKKATQALRSLRTQVLHAQNWFWEDWYHHLARPGRQFLNQEEAARWVEQGQQALQSGDRKLLERAVSWLWSLLPPDEQAARQERAVKPGLKQ